MTLQSGRDGESPRDGESRGAGRDPRPTRRGVLLSVGLAGLGGTLAGCSTAAVPYDANEAGIAEQDAGTPAPAPSGPAPARPAASMPAASTPPQSPPAATSPAQARPAQSQPAESK